MSKPSSLKPKGEDPADPGRHEHENDKDAEGCHCYDSSFPKGDLPPPPILKKLEPEDEPKKKKGKDGVDKAMDILDEYYEGVPLRDPDVDHGGED